MKAAILVPVTWIALVALLAGSGRVQAQGRPYLYHSATALSRGHSLSMAIARKELGKAGFENPSPPGAWEQFATNADTLILVTSVPLSASRTYVHVLATSNNDASAKKWSSAIMRAIETSKMVMID